MAKQQRMIYLKVSGDSMSPLYLDGDQIAVDSKAYQAVLPAVGDIVLCEHPYIKAHLMIKKIQSIDQAGRYFVVGINAAESTDSRSFGSVAANKIVGKVIGKK